MTDLTHPGTVVATLDQIAADLASRQNEYEDAARAWYTAQREIKREHARALLSAQEGTVTEKKAQADLAAYDVEGADSEAEFEAQRAVIKTLELRAMIGMAILKAHGRS